ncbi:hypothetical protein BGZ91_011205 [Linnemannia elongata]|nr:hypothetical protein BGZ91_011205 [Linnemannia elongata]KAG0081750.1 hypothetical protein BGZ90_005112 [Linnemannia elongata]
MGRKSGRSLNPADQYRKEQHKKEIKKNKQDRKKVRELGSVLRDTTTESELAEHEELEKQGKLDKDGVKRLAELREKMSKIIEVKKAHGIKIKPKKVEASKPVPVAEPVRDPTRSIYYDPVLNPFGAPPPGQPYLEYPPLPPPEVPLGQGMAPGMDQQQQQQKQPEEGSGSDSDDSSSDSDSNSDSDSDTSSGSESEDEDDENYMPPLPEGPAPTKQDQARYLEPTKAKPGIDMRIQYHHQRPYMHEMQPPGMFPHGMHPPPGLPGQQMSPYGPPMGFQPQYGNVYPPGRPGPGHGHPPGYGPPGYGPPGFGPPGGVFRGPEAPGGFGPPGHHQRPPYAGPPHIPRPSRPPSQRPPPRYVKPPRTSDAQSDPMTGHLPPDEKEKKRQEENKETSTPAAPHPLPPKPTIAQVPVKPAVVAGPTSISAEPQLRNLQKELVHLVPSAIMRKRVTQKGKIGRPVNAAPGIEEDYQSATSSSSVTNATATTTTAFASQGSSENSRQNEKEEEEGHRETALGLRLPKINLAPSVPSFLSSSRMVINSAPEVPAAPVDKAAKKKAEYDEFMQGLEGDGLL